MSWRISSALVMTVLVGVWGPGHAIAAGWPIEASGAPSLGYAAEYVRADGSTATHTGVDIPAGPGASVMSVDSGTVTFAGRIPSAAGGSMLAVTIESPTGARWSFMPLAELGVEPGASVGVGEVLGSLAASGDPSSEGAHVHVSVRQGDLYVDPMSLLVAPSPAGETDTQSEGDATVCEPAPNASTSVADSAAQPAPVEAADAAAAPAASPSPAPATAGAPDPATAPRVEAEGVQGEQTLTHGRTEPAPSAQPLASGGSLDAPARAHSAGFGRVHVEDIADTRTPGSSTAPGRRVGWRVVVAVFGLGPAVGRSAFRRFRSRITAPGDTVAAVVGR